MRGPIKMASANKYNLFKLFEIIRPQRILKIFRYFKILKHFWRNLKIHTAYLVTLKRIALPRKKMYVITSKDKYSGTSSSDIANPLEVTEIATELVITRLYLIALVNQGKLPRKVCIVCAEDRKSLYTKTFDEVITYTKFKELKISSKFTIDLLGQGIFNKLASGDVERRLLPYLPFYRNWERDKESILSFQESTLDNYDLSRKFVALVIRLRGAWPEKNLPSNFWSMLIQNFTDAKIPVFIFGKEAEIFCNYENVNFISSFQDWCTLIKHPNLMNIGSTMTGAVYPALIFGSAKTKITLIDNLNLINLHGHDPSFYNPCINFAGCKIDFIDTIPTPKEFFNALTKSL